MQASLCKPWPSYDKETPAASSLGPAFHQLQQPNVELAIEAMCRLGGAVLRIDHSFKIVKHFGPSARCQASALLSCLNELGLVVAWYGTEGTSLEEVRAAFAAYQARCERIQGKVGMQTYLKLSSSVG